MEDRTVIVIGGGLAGCEAAWQIARRGAPVRLLEMRPERTTGAHRTGLLAELVCSNYPECKNTRSIPVGVKCPEEGCDGDLTEKRTRNGRTFYGCSRYPECKFALWNKPVQEKCPACGYPVMVEKRTKSQGDFLECPQCKEKKELQTEQG